MTDDADKRRVTRAEVKTRCRATVHMDSGEIAGVLRNISTAGARVELEAELELDVGDRLRLDLATPYGNCACEGRLAWKTPGAVGVEFTELPMDPRDPLNRFVHAPGVLHWMWRTFWDVADRREQARAYLTTFCPVSFTFDGAVRTAAMRNLSDGGAMLQVDEVTAFPPGTDLTLTIKTPAGDSLCRARVMWTDHSDEEAFLAGVQFLDLEDGLAEPLRALMDAPF